MNQWTVVIETVMHVTVAYPALRVEYVVLC